MAEDIIDAEHTALAVVDERALPAAPPSGMLDTADPEEFMARAERICRTLMKVVRDRKLSRNLGGNKDHLDVEAWQFLGSMPWLRCNAVIEWVKEVGGDGSGKGWEARAVVYRDGQIVGAGEGMCLREERNWSRKDYFALKSMAQTRATSRALQGPLRWLVVFAGYSGAGSEEMPPDDNPPADPPKRAPRPVSRQSAPISEAPPASRPAAQPSPAERAKANAAEDSERRRKLIAAIKMRCKERGINDALYREIIVDTFGPRRFAGEAKPTAKVLAAAELSKLLDAIGAWEMPEPAPPAEDLHAGPVGQLFEESDDEVVY